MTSSFNARKLTKSRFKIGMDCPRKLYYGGLKDVYANQQIDDPFLESLAEGGFQVGELAKEYFSGGIDIQTLDYDEALEQTNKLLKQENVIIFEAAVKYDELFIRADVLEKRGNTFYLYEVKAKSVGKEGRKVFLTQKEKPTSKWKPYLYDVAFQKHVIQNAFPESRVFSHLMLVDKTIRSTSSGLNQKFHVRTNKEGRKEAYLAEPLTDKEREERILTSINVDDICADIFSAEDHRHNESESFSDLISRLASYSLGNEVPNPALNKDCGKCEFFCKPSDVNLKDGRIECVSLISGMSQESVSKTPLIFELWNHHDKQGFIDKGQIRLADVQEDDIGADPYEAGAGLVNKQRQWLQVQKCQYKDPSVWIDKIGLRSEMANWVFPLNFIDFETTRVALPFHENQVPYEAIAFQFSHHILYEDGRLIHHKQFLNTTPGVFPNIEFIRSLKDSLECNEGSIFCYSHHENSILNAIKTQLETELSEPDSDDLVEFIKQIAKPKGKSVEKWESSRLMIDLLEIVKKYLYLPETHGSNSIKYVLPAMLSQSDFLRSKYGKPIYQDPSIANSLNFPAEWIWLQIDDLDGVKDPYKILPPVFEGYGIELDDRISSFEDINNGGAALTAYAKLQFADISNVERSMIESALFKYCELDTLAMVMLYEFIRDHI